MKKKILLLFAFGILTHLPGQAQQQKINERYLGVSRIGILQDLSEKYEFLLDIKEEDFPHELLPLQTFQNEDLSSVVDHLLSGTELIYKLSDGKLVIRKSRNLQATTDKHYNPTRFNFSLSGEVRDAENGETLPYATINIRGTPQGATTNMDGKFSLLQVPSDTATLQISYIGYRPILYRLTPSNAKGFLTIHLLPAADVLEEIVIEDAHERQLMDASDEVSKISISPTQLSSLPSFGEKDIFRSIQLLPGISGTNEATSGLYVRGGTPDQNLILFDGITVYHVDHFYGFFSAFNAEAVKDIQLYKGGFAPKYGGRLSSVVNITGKNGNSQNVAVHAGISALSANASVEVPLFNRKGSLLVAGRRSYTDIIKSGIYNDVFDLFNESSSTNTGTGGFTNGFGPRQQIAETEPAFYYYDFNSKLTVNPSQKDVVSVSFYRGQDNLDNSRNQSFTGRGFGNPRFGNNNTNNSISNSTTDLTNWGNTGSSLRWGRQWTPRFFSNLVASYSRYYSNRDRYSTTYTTINNEQQENHTGNVERNRVEDYSLRWDNELKVGQKHNVEFGLQGTQNTIGYHLTMNDTLNLMDQDETGLQMAVYVQDSWEVTSKLTSTFGLRSTFFSPTESFYQEPRISLQYQLNPQWKLKGAWGKYYQFVNRIVREDVSQGTRDFWLLADDTTIPIGSAYHYIAGFSYEIDEFLFDVEGYYKDLTGLMEYTLRFSNGFRQNESNEYFYQGTGSVKGIDFLLQKKVGKYTGWVSYTLSSVEYNFPDISSEPYPALHDQTHEIKLINSYQIGPWKLAVTWMYATGKPYTAPVGRYSLTMLDGSEQSYVSIGSKNAFRLPAYHRMDLSATYQFSLSEKTKMNAGLSIFNLYGRKNIWYKEFEIVDDSLVETNVELVGFTPNIFVNINFN